MNTLQWHFLLQIFILRHFPSTFFGIDIDFFQAVQFIASLILYLVTLSGGTPSIMYYYNKAPNFFGQLTVYFCIRSNVNKLGSTV